MPDESEWFTSPELEELYNSRQTPSASFDATAKGQLIDTDHFHSTNRKCFSRLNEARSLENIKKAQKVTKACFMK